MILDSVEQIVSNVQIFKMGEIMARRVNMLPVDILVAGRIRTARLGRGYTQQEVAKELGLTFQQVQKYEKGANRVSVGRLHAISNFLGVPMNYFLQGLDNNSTNTHDIEALDAALNTKEGVRVAAALSRIRRAPIRRHVADLLEAILDAEADEFRLIN
jgi:transcriptional regulator with XRE-family HTH domain